MPAPSFYFSAATAVGETKPKEPEPVPKWFQNCIASRRRPKELPAQKNTARWGAVSFIETRFSA